MIVCDICTGFHPMADCLTARRHLDACVISGTPDDYERPNNVVALVTELTYAKQTASDLGRRRAERHHRRITRDHQGIEVTRIA